MRNSASVVQIASNMLFADGLTGIIQAAGFKVAACSPAVDEATLAKADACTSVILIMDVEDLDGAIRQVEMFKERFPDAKVAVITDDAKLPNAVMAFQDRVDAYVRRNCSRQTFVKVLELIELGERFVPSVVLPQFADTRLDTMLPLDGAMDPVALAPGDAAFSTQEARILSLIVCGHPNKIIARQLSIAEATVKVHVKAILRKLNVANRTQAAIWAVNNRPKANVFRAPPLPQPMASMMAQAREAVRA